MRQVLLGSAVALALGCGGTGSDSGEQATIDEAVAQEAVELASSAISICHAGTGLQSSPPQRESSAARLLQTLRSRGYLQGDGRANILPPTKPDDEFGDCGGRVTFPTYNHSNGTTSGTVSFENFCSLNESTGNRNTVSGTATFVDRGTPSAQGPITTAFEASSPGGLTVIEQSSSGATLSSERLSFTDFNYVIGVPGGTPTASSPDRVTLEDASVIDLDENETYRLSNFSASGYNTTSGGQVQTFSGRSHLPSGGFVDFSTTSPITLDAEGNVLSGQITFSGAGGTTAVITLVPGSIVQATLTVNGTPVTNVPACR